MTGEEVALNEHLHHYLQTYVKSLKLTDPTFRVIRGSNKGDNFLGIIYRVTIQGVENGELKSKHLVLKTMSSHTSVFVKPRQLYLREIFFYGQVLPIFKEGLKEHDGIANFFPAFYGANDEPENEALLLENLIHEGFTMKNSRLMDYPHAALTIRRLGELHAYSFALRAADPASFDRLKQMEEPMFPRQDSVREARIPQEKVDLVAKLLMDEGEHYAERFRAFSADLFQSLIDAVDGSLAEPYAVVNHGDLWTNNILFKYDQVSEDCCEEKIPCDLRFLDFQLCRYASPAIDLTYMLYCSCTWQTRNKYYDQLIREYYETLSTCLKRFGYDSNLLFPYEALSQQLVSFGKYAVGMVLLVLYFITDTKGCDLTDVENNDKFQERLQNDKLFRNTLKNAFIDLIDKNYI